MVRVIPCSKDTVEVSKYSIVDTDDCTIARKVILNNRLSVAGNIRSSA